MRLSKGKIFLLILVIILLGGVYYGIQAGKIATAYAAKIACSCTMVSHRSIESVYKEDLAKYSYITAEVNEKDRSVTASIAGLISRKAIFRKGLGCTLVNGVNAEELRKQVKEEEMTRPLKHTDSWTEANKDTTRSFLNIDTLLLNKAINKAFIEIDSNNIKRTRAVLVVYKGKIIGEKYAPGINQNTPLLGWSMTKSITNALIGILVGQGKLNIDDRAFIEEWADSDDPRSKITIDQLLRMSSGLNFDEVYNIVSDATKMLFNSPSSAQVALSKTLDFQPDSMWSYSSGTTNILSLLIRRTIGENQAEYFNFPRKVLFNKIGMNSAVMEPDPSGTFVGSSFMYATARDWAKFGLLYLNDGVWKGERILPEGWVKYSSTPTPKAPQGQYGAHFWLNAGEDKNGKNRKWPDAPKDMYYASGFEGQQVVILPSHEMVIVRLGNTQKREAWDIGLFVEDILHSLKN